ncbi:MAG: phosphatidylglycerophosphatase A [Kiritimatiellia bacterium]|nr:phosphatidylglycerophosphatase A [Lentisphaerota bacterium]
MKVFAADMSWPRRVLLFLATGGWMGYAPVASGTFGTLPGLLLMWALAPLWRSAGLWPWQLLIAVLLAILAVPVCGFAERYFGRKDDGRIVADEYLTFPIGLLGLPLTPLTLAVAFVTNRAMDILKPPPARRLQDLGGGTGIVIDDFISTFYSLAINHLLFYFYEIICRHSCL